MWKYKRLKDKSKPETKNFGFFVFKFFDILKWPGGEMVKRGRLKICYPRGETVSVRIRLGLQKKNWLDGGMVYTQVWEAWPKGMRVRVPLWSQRKSQWEVQVRSLGGVCNNMRYQSQNSDGRLSDMAPSFNWIGRWSSKPKMWVRVPQELQKIYWQVAEWSMAPDC